MMFCGVIGSFIMPAILNVARRLTGTTIDSNKAVFQLFPFNAFKDTTNNISLCLLICVKSAFNFYVTLLLEVISTFYATKTRVAVSTIAAANRSTTTKT